jgi:hypothetical protein
MHQRVAMIAVAAAGVMLLVAAVLFALARRA